nr:protein kinase-like domain, concanavalin A-like lectin/glucanase domain protein [Tanacetum cinerariifolium]
MEAHLDPKPFVQVNTIASSCEIYGGLYDTQYCMENLEQAFVNYASSRNNRVGADCNTSRNQRYEHRGLNFGGIRMDMHVFVENMSYVMDFTILENVEANIDSSLSQVVFGRPFVETTKLILDREKGLITFTDGIREVTFKTPYKDSDLDDLTSEGHDLLSSRVILSKDDVRRGCKSPSDLEN